MGHTHLRTNQYVALAVLVDIARLTIERIVLLAIGREVHSIFGCV